MRSDDPFEEARPGPRPFGWWLKAVCGCAKATLSGGRETGTDEQQMANEDTTQVLHLKTCAEPTLSLWDLSPSLSRMLNTTMRKLQVFMGAFVAAVATWHTTGSRCRRNCHVHVPVKS